MKLIHTTRLILLVLSVTTLASCIRSSSVASSMGRESLFTGPYYDNRDLIAEVPPDSVLDEYFVSRGLTREVLEDLDSMTKEQVEQLGLALDDFFVARRAEQVQFATDEAFQGAPDEIEVIPLQDGDFEVIETWRNGTRAATRRYITSDPPDHRRQ